MREIKKSLNDITKKILESYAPNLTNEEIDLIKTSSTEGLRYKIVIHNTSIEIGYIEYRGYHYDINLGDIGYNISPEYRGNNYAYKAVCLLSELLIKNGIKDFWITSLSDNLASLKIIEKFGGECLGNSDNIFKYRCGTENIARRLLS